MSTGPDTEREDTLNAYLAGRLEGPEAEAFETRLFEDDELAAELERALEIRAAVLRGAESDGVAAPAGGWWRPRHHRWLALAATVAVAVVGVRLMVSDPAPPQSSFRGIETELALRAQPEGSGYRLRWTAVPGAGEYELLVLDSGGAIVMSRQSTETTVVVEQPASAGAFVEVVALDGLGQELARSRRLALPES